MSPGSTSTVSGRQSPIRRRTTARGGGRWRAHRGSWSPPTSGASVDLPAFAGAVLDRADPARKDPGWVRTQLSDPGSRAVAASADAVLIDGDALLRLPPPADAAILLGLEEGRAVFALDLADAPAQGELVSLRGAG